MSDRTYGNDQDSGSAGITVTGFLLGAVVGAGLALLLAPGPGGETRKKLGETARRLSDKAGDIVSRVREGESDPDTFRRGGATSGVAGTES